MKERGDNVNGSGISKVLSTKVSCSVMVNSVNGVKTDVHFYTHICASS